MSTADTETADAFLGGRLILHQPRTGYRAGADPVLLAAAVTARPGQSVLDLGCGAGAAMFCLAARVPGLEMHGLEVQHLYAALAERNAARNGIAATIHRGDLSAMPATLRAMRFDHVISNPPYHDRGTGTPSTHPPRETAFGESLPLADWVALGARRLQPRGTMSVIQKADRLPDLITAMATALGSIRIRPIQPREGRPASLVIVQAIKGGRSPARLDPPLVLHTAPLHQTDNGDLSGAARSILRDGAPLL
ncbi:tRNA1(Val) (adenine(37)-N6)-methyltransferase [Palleronia abyssalis]|uniref:tRNA1(Val) (Adenine(37)-N6)-methyltransferase n=1 Tax=Palleronia abyssalis TaxID=1501240 RepID=A0A2R8BTU4_9RHOB|nr:methyltransferase [Palleronia abyssalis]SPJ23553.1 tRNA1(Val) (adenine(37)-N6)-methyltransferase [Palleronia abyssalis]